MKPSGKTIGSRGVLAAVFFLAAGTVQITSGRAATDFVFDQGSESLYKSYDSIPDNYLTAGPGARNLNGYYEQRQYPG